MEALCLQLHSLGTHISVSEGFSEIWEAFIHRTPELQSLAPEQNTPMGRIAPAAFPVGLGLGLHPQPVPHPTLVGMLGVAQGRSSLRSLRLASALPASPGARKGPARRAASLSATALLAARGTDCTSSALWVQSLGVTMTRLPAPGPSPFPRVAS